MLVPEASSSDDESEQSLLGKTLEVSCGTPEETQ
jgi:hypothetical protein